MKGGLGHAWPVIFFNVGLPGIRKDYPAPIYETHHASIYKLISEIVGP